MASAFPSYCYSSSTSADYFRLDFSPVQPRSLPVSHRHLFPRLKIHCPSRILQFPKSFRRSDRIVCEASETPLEVPTVTDETWESLVLDADCPVLVEFWAPWCGPCRMFHPVVGELSRQYAGRLKCLNLNTDGNPSIASKYGIRSIPTIMIFVNGKKKDEIIGAVPKTTLTASIDKFL